MAKLGFGIALSLLCSQANAQDIGNATRELPRRGEDHFLVGVGALATPAYQGSSDYRVVPVPIVDIASGPFFANLRNGVGMNVIDAGVFKVGGSVAIMPGYRRRDVPQGVGRLRIGAGGRLFATVNAAGAVFTIGGTQGFAGSTRGAIADASLAYPIIASSRLVLIPSIGASWANRKHNDRYFGIDARAALASGLPRYRAGSGFKDATAGLTTSYQLTDRISLLGAATLTTLLGDAKDSPLVEKRTRPTGLLSVAYRL